MGVVWCGVEMGVVWCGVVLRWAWCGVVLRWAWCGVVLRWAGADLGKCTCEHLPECSVRHRAAHSTQREV
jgi:hypothetical protein